MTRSISAIGRFAFLLILATPMPSLGLPYDAIYVLGDSLSDQGNLFAATRAVAGPANALPASDHYFNGRFSNGPVYTDIIAQRSGLPLGPSIAGGNNFAYGGARTTYNTVEQIVGGPFPNGLFPWSLNAEVQAFNARGVHDPNALYIVFSGSNDIADILLLPGLVPATVISTAVNGIVNAVQAFANAGARTVVVPNIPDLGLTPAFRSLGPPATNPASLLSLQFNNALHAGLGAFSGLNIIEFQTDDLFNDLVANPGRYGLTNVTSPCYSGFVVPNPSGTECANPNQFLFWDRVHPTTTAQGIFAQALLVQVPEPSTISLLLVNMLALGVVFGKAGRRRRALQERLWS